MKLRPSRLSSRKVRYFAEPSARAVLFPTLVAGCYRNERNCEIATSEVAAASLAEYLLEHVRTARALGGVDASAPPPSERAVHAAAALAERVPVGEWESAAAYFGGIPAGGARADGARADGATAA